MRGIAKSIYKHIDQEAALDGECHEGLRRRQVMKSEGDNGVEGGLLFFLSFGHFDGAQACHVRPQIFNQYYSPIAVTLFKNKIK